MKKPLRLAAAAFAMLWPCRAHAQGIVPPGAGPITRAFGGTAVGVALDVVGSLYWNPATLSFLRNRLDMGAEGTLQVQSLESSVPANAISPGVPATRLVGRNDSDDGLLLAPSLGFTLSLSGKLRAFTLGEFPAVITEHLPASMAPRHWENPSVFDPDRYKSAQTTTDHDEAHCREIGLARCPFSKESLPVKDGRSVAMTNTAFGAIHAEVDGQPHPLVDTAGYAPFGFGYRRCAGEYITIEFVKEYLRAIWSTKLSFQKLDTQKAERVPNNPHTVLNDDVTFQRAR